MLPRDARVLGVRAAGFLVLAIKRGLGVSWRLWAADSGCFLTVDAERTRDVCLVGVTADEMTLALALRLPGDVMDILLVGGTASLFGVPGMVCCEPSLVDGLLPLDVADAGRSGGGMLLSLLKKLDLRLPFFGAGEDGSCDRLSMVLSESEGRCWSEPSETAASCSASLSWCAARELAREDALEADLKPSRRPNVSSGPPGTEDEAGRDDSLGWDETGRARGFLKAEASLWLEEALEAAVEVRRWPKLGMPLTLREEE